MLNLDNLKNVSKNQLIENLKLISENIKENKTIKCCGNFLKLINEEMNELPDLNVLKGLREVLNLAQAKGLGNALKNQLDIIRNLSKKIIRGHLAQELPQELIVEILSKMNPKEAALLNEVSKRWYLATPKAAIKAINESEISLKRALNTTNAQEAVEFIVKNPASKMLKYADFSKMDGFDNHCLEKLTKACPNLETLLIRNSEVTDLKHLKCTPSLKSLDINGSKKIQTKALESLKYTLKLQHLNLSRCEQIQGDALESLRHTSHLLSLSL